MNSRKYSTGKKTNKGKVYWTKARRTQFNYWVILLSVVVIAVSIIGVSDKYTENYINKFVHNTNPLQIQVVKAETIPSQTTKESVVPEKLNESPEQTIRRLAKEQNFKWEDYLVRLAFHESSLNPDATNKNRDGSIDYGIFQWNDKYHPEVSQKCAFSVECATLKAMEAINAGHQSWWVADNKSKHK